MNVQQIEATAKDVVVKHLNVAPEQVQGTTTWADLNADSLARIEITLALEDAFKVNIPDDEAVKFNTFADVVAFLDRQVSAGPAVAASRAP